VKGKEILVERIEGAKLGDDVLNAVKSGIRNMCIGAKDGYVRNMQVIYAHFPISLEVKGSVLKIKNFIGEKQNREAGIVGGTKVEVKGQNLTISGPDKEAVGQTVANIKRATKIRNRDPRVFQDGLYIVE
jgi:large subunit ribosomal protein L6